MVGQMAGALVSPLSITYDGNILKHFFLRLKYRFYLITLYTMFRMVLMVNSL